MALFGGCHCGEVRYAIVGEPLVHAICHCEDCRRTSGAPAVSWLMMTENQFKITKGAPKWYASSADTRRSFCVNCGTGIHYINEAMLPGMIDVRSATLDEPETVPPHIQMQIAESLPWMAHAYTLPAFDRYPPPA